jgi:hypothetical protein
MGEYSDTFHPGPVDVRNDATDAPDGIALVKKFSYEVETRGNLLRVSISHGELAGGYKY